MLKRQSKNKTSQKMIVPKLTVFKGDPLLPSVTAAISSNNKHCRDRTPERSRATRTKSVDYESKTGREKIKSDSPASRRQSDSAVKFAIGSSRRSEATNLQLLDIRSQSGAESIISSKSGGSGGTSQSNGGRKQRRNSELIIYNGKTKKWNSLEPIQQVQPSCIGRNTESSLRKIRSVNSLYDDNKNKASERWRPNGHKPERTRHLSDSKTVDMSSDNNNMDDELGEDEQKMLNEKVQSWLDDLDADASGSFIRREIATANTSSS